MAKNGVAEAVQSVLDGMAFVRFPLSNDLINYSALARFIKPLVEERMGGRKAGMDALIMAVRRYARNLGGDGNSADLLKVMGEAKLVLRTGMTVLHFGRTNEIYSKLIDTEHNKVNWHSGDKMYVLQRSEELMVTATSKLLPIIHVEIDRDDILAEYGNLAMITVENTEEPNRVPGGLAFIANQLAAINVNIFTVFNSITKMSFLVTEADASRAYDKLRKAIEECRRAAELAAK